MNDSKFLGVCMVIAAIIVGGALCYVGRSRAESGRYQFQSSTPPGVIWVMDTTTGEIKTR